MQPVLLNTYDFGGAANATIRIHRGLRRIGVDSRMLVQLKRGDDPTIDAPRSTLGRISSIGRVLTDSLPTWFHGGAEGGFSVNWLPDRVHRKVERLDADVVHLNWIGDGFLSPRTIGQFDRPIVWRLPDMWAFTGGCHYADGCDRYVESCGTCPKLHSGRSWDLSRWVHGRKARSWSDADITVVGPSTWIADRARESDLLGDRRIEVIPNGLDTDVYRPRDASTGRNLYDLPANADVVLFGAQAPNDPRKGADLLRDALGNLANEGLGEDIVLVVFGASDSGRAIDTGFETRYTGYVHDDQRLAMLYAAADVMVIPSRYEGFGQTAMESMACGTPVVAFDATGPKDIVDHRETGYLADPYEPTALARGIRWVLEDADRRSDLGIEARRTAVERFDIETVAERYRDLYEQIS